MMFKTLTVIGLVAAANAAELRGSADELEHLDLEVVVEGGQRQLFPLLPGTKCPAGHKCHSRTTGTIGATMQNSLTKVFRDNYKTTLAAQMDWNEFNNEMNTVVSSNHFCSRRQAMARAAGLAAGVAASTVAMPAYAASTTEVKMGSDSGQLVFVPASITICAGDTVKWCVFFSSSRCCGCRSFPLELIDLSLCSFLLAPISFFPSLTTLFPIFFVLLIYYSSFTTLHKQQRRTNNKGGPHNVVFDEDAIPSGVDQESISMDEQLGEEGDTFSKKFDTKGPYEYYCEPHRGAGMNAKLTVS